MGYYRDTIQVYKSGVMSCPNASTRAPPRLLSFLGKTENSLDRVRVNPPACKAIIALRGPMVCRGKPMASVTAQLLLRLCFPCVSTRRL
jgi:hypothetical protein